MSNQVQCPNCGGYKVSSSEKPVTEKTPVPIWQRTAMGVLGLSLLGLAFILSSGDTIEAWGFVCTGTLSLLVALFSNTNAKIIGKYYESHCLLCGYRWNWQEGQSMPKVIVNSDLIAKGAQRLEEEERISEEIRKRQ